MHNKILLVRALFLVLLPQLPAQTTNQVHPNPDCQFFFTLTAANQFLPAGNGFDNRQRGCTSWNFSYVNSGFSGLTVTLQSAPNNAGSAGSWATGFGVQQATVSGSNAATNTTAGFWWATGTNAFVRVILTGTTGSGIVNGAVYGWRIPNAASSGTGGGITCLSGDVAAGSGGGCTAATVQGIESVPFCTGYTPTNGQFVQYTTGGSPNPCYSAAAATASTGNAASVVAYTPSASVTLTCPSSAAGTVTVFDPSGTALAANMALSFASCTTGQIVIVRVIQAASGGPFTVSGLPAGSPQISTYPSAGTIYTLQASSATAMNFVNFAANAGAFSLGSGANGISRTVTAGAAGVTVNLLAAKDASNPSRYQTAAVNTCGNGVAAYTATSGNLFELYSVPGTVLTMVADGTVTAGDLVTGGASTAGRVADTGQTAQTAVAIGTCIVGAALANATVGNTVLVNYYGEGTQGAGAATSVAWSAITNPTANLSLTMAAQTSTFTYNATTGAAANLWVLTDTASNTGTGALMRLFTASGSAAYPWQADANGIGWEVNTAGNLVSLSTATEIIGGAIALGTSTTANYLTLQNTTPAILGTQQVSPALHWSARGYSSGSSASESVDFIAWVKPLQGGGTPTGLLNFQFSVNGGAYSTVMSVDNAGNFLTLGNATFAAAATLNFSTRDAILSPANGQFQITNSAQTGVGLASTGAGDVFACYNTTSFQVTSGNCGNGAGTLTVAGIISGGTKFTITGCSAGTTVGGATAGSFLSGTTGACAVVITMNGATGLTAPNGWSCDASDLTTPANLISQSASSATTCTVSGTTVSGDKIQFHAIAF